jgi:hypothetical protein
MEDKQLLALATAILTSCIFIMSGEAVMKLENRDYFGHIQYDAPYVCMVLFSIGMLGISGYSFIYLHHQATLLTSKEPEDKRDNNYGNASDNNVENPLN